MMHIIDKKALGWNSTQLILTILGWLENQLSGWKSNLHPRQCDFEDGGLSQFYIFFKRIYHLHRPHTIKPPRQISCSETKQVIMIGVYIVWQKHDTCQHSDELTKQ